MDKKDVTGILRGRVPGFAKALAPIYKSLNWTWGTDVPRTQDEIEQTLLELIDHFDGEGNRSTGGLEVFFDKENSEIGISFTYCDSIFF